MNSDMVKLEKFGHLHLVYHFTVPLILEILMLYTCKVCEMFVYKHTETIEYVKN